MTSLLRRKRPTTARGRTTPAPTPASLLAALLLLAGSAAHAQQPVVWSSNGSPAAAPAPTQGPGSAPSALPASVASAGSVQLARYQQETYEQAREYQIQLEPPGLERLSQLNSDPALEERIRQETRLRNEKERDVFPPSPVLSNEVYRGRGSVWQHRTLTVEPNFTVYHHLYFEDKNAERYGWELGPLQPMLSALEFYADFVMLPYKLNKNLFDNDECSTGYCLPGDPVPLMIYPPQVTVRGLVSELGALAAVIAIFP